jgi:phosphotransferase system  glucose/maltose/N-acetylglucosamine-specific IIC component
MDPFEYVVVLTSLILGLGIAQILTGIADVLTNLRNTKLYLPHILFVLVIFLLHIQEWWINFQYASEVPLWTLKIVLCVLSYPILLFVMARMAFPTGIRGNETDFKKHYHDQWRYLL